MPSFTTSEQRLLDMAHAEFGETLTRFLLSGLGEEQVGQRWHFTINYTNNEGNELRRYLKAITYEPLDGSIYLPQRRDPLILIALLQLLLQASQAPPGSLRYKQEEVLSLLGWKDTPKARKEIDGAIDRYFLLKYEWKMNKKELADSSLSLYTASLSMISEYEFIDEEFRESGHVGRIINKVVFNGHFIEQLRRRELFGIDWNNIRSIKRHT